MIIDKIYIVLISTIALFVLLEIFIFCYIRLKNFLFTEEKTRKDFLDPKYHKYLRRYESAKPIFKYIPIGLRSFNFEDEEIKGVKNNFYI